MRDLLPSDPAPLGLVKWARPVTRLPPYPRYYREHRPGIIAMRRAAVAFAALALTIHAQAADFTPMDGLDGRPAIRISGDIVSGDAARFSHFISSHYPVYSMILSGAGGDAYEATKLGTFVHSSGMPVAISAGEKCASACALIWVGSSQRFIEPGGSVGFHGIFTFVEGKAKPSSDGNAVIGAYLGRVGFSDPAIAYMTAKQPTEMQWLSEADARRFGINYVTATPPSAFSEPKRVSTYDIHPDGQMIPPLAHKAPIHAVAPAIGDAAPSDE